MRSFFHHFTQALFGGIFQGTSNQPLNCPDCETLGQSIIHGAYFIHDSEIGQARWQLASALN